MSFRTWFAAWKERRRKSRLLSMMFTFKGWKDTALAATYHDSLGFYADEMIGHRTAITLPKSILQFNMSKAKGDAPDVGSQLEVIYFPSAIDRDGIKIFLDQAGLIVE